jgi:hypothetical protein
LLFLAKRNQIRRMFFDKRRKEREGKREREREKE